jgi:uncharacterized protein (DUF1499 family)
MQLHSCFQIILFTMVSVTSGPGSGQIPPGQRPNPLKPCPGTPNCHIAEIDFNEGPELIFDKLVQALRKTGAESVSPEPGKLHVSAVYKIPLFGYRDDVTAQVLSGETSETILFIRSASRVGHSDLGVNQRRVKRILNQLQKL